MTDAVDLGTIPLRIVLHLSRGADFGCVLRRRDGSSWTGTVSIEVGSQVWTAANAGTDATFTVQSALVDDAIDEHPKQAQLWYRAGILDLLYGEGPVNVHA